MQLTSSASDSRFPASARQEAAYAATPYASATGAYNQYQGLPGQPGVRGWSLGRLELPRISRDHMLTDLLINRWATNLPVGRTPGRPRQIDARSYTKTEDAAAPGQRGGEHCTSAHWPWSAAIWLFTRRAHSASYIRTSTTRPRICIRSKYSIIYQRWRRRP